MQSLRTLSSNKHSALDASKTANFHTSKEMRTGVQTHNGSRFQVLLLCCTRKLDRWRPIIRSFNRDALRDSGELNRSQRASCCIRLVRLQSEVSSSSYILRWLKILISACVHRSFNNLVVVHMRSRGFILYLSRRAAFSV